MTIPIISKNKEDAQKLARKFENYKLIDILKEIKIKQGIVFNSPNNGKNLQIEKLRKYEVNMIMENHKNTVRIEGGKRRINKSNDFFHDNIVL